VTGPAPEAPLTTAEQAEIAARRAASPLRVQAVDLPGGRRVWLKQVEQLSGLRRMQKGDPARAFAAECTALRLLAQAGQPVPVVLAMAADHIVLADGGPNLERLLAQRALERAEAQAALVAVGAALAGLHRLGMTHGRPVLRDFCWIAGRLTMIDLERFRPGRAGAFWQGLDLVIFLQGWFSRLNPADADAPLLEAALTAYRAGAPAGAWAGLIAWGRWLRLLRPVARGLARIRPVSREVTGALRMLDHLAALVAAAR
jgi:tRNA A-37 threonylcarbamoyl transferase component Bud32